MKERLQHIKQLLLCKGIGSLLDLSGSSLLSLLYTPKGGTEQDRQSLWADGEKVASDLRTAIKKTFVS